MVIPPTWRSPTDKRVGVVTTRDASVSPCTRRHFPRLVRTAGADFYVVAPPRRWNPALTRISRETVGMATQPGAPHDVRSPRQRAFALAIALAAAFASASSRAGTEIALRFYDDNAAAQGRSLSSTAQAAIETDRGRRSRRPGSRCRRRVSVRIRRRAVAGRCSQRAQQAACHRCGGLRRRRVRRSQLACKAGFGGAPAIRSRR